MKSRSSRIHQWANPEVYVCAMFSIICGESRPCVSIFVDYDLEVIYFSWSISPGDVAFHHCLAGGSWHQSIITSVYAENIPLSEGDVQITGWVCVEC